jgi:hypothetical protein
LLKIGAPSKKLPRGRPFKKGERLPFQFKPGQSGNPSGTSKKPKTMKANYEELLGSPAPAELCRAVGAPPESTLGEVYARGMLVRAVLYDTAAAKEIREVVEGRIPDFVDDKNVIDYSAGQTFKELLLSKLASRDGPGHADGEHSG